MLPVDITGAVALGATRWLAALAIVVGVALCFFGFRLFRFWIALVACVMLGLLASGYAQYAIPGAAVSVLFGVIGAVVGALLGYKLYLVGVFLQGAIVGAVLGTFLSPEQILWALVLAIGGGIIAVKLVRPVVIITTSLFGGLGASWSLGVLLGMREGLLFVILGAVMALLGMVLQFKQPDKRADAS